MKLDLRHGDAVFIVNHGWARVETVYMDEGTQTRAVAKLYRDGTERTIVPTTPFKPSLVGIRILRKLKGASRPHWQWLQANGQNKWFLGLSHATAYAKTMVRNRAYIQIKICATTQETEELLTLSTIKI